MASVTLTKSVDLRDADQRGQDGGRQLEPGTHQMEEKENPGNCTGTWLVVPGTNLGLSKEWLASQPQATIN